MLTFLLLFLVIGSVFCESHHKPETAGTALDPTKSIHSGVVADDKNIVKKSANSAVSTPIGSPVSEISKNVKATGTSDQKPSDGNADSELKARKSRQVYYDGYGYGYQPVYNYYGGGYGGGYGGYDPYYSSGYTTTYYYPSYSYGYNSNPFGYGLLGRLRERIYYRRMNRINALYGPSYGYSNYGYGNYGYSGYSYPSYYSYGYYR